VSDAAFAEVRRPALRREHRDRCHGARVGRIVGRNDNPGQIAAAVKCRPRRARRREERVEHRFLAFRGLAERGDPARRRLEGRNERRRGGWMFARKRSRGPQERRAIQRPGRAAHRADQRLAGLAERVRGRRGIGRVRGRSLPRVEHRHDRREPAVHIDSVIAVADLLVERGERRGLLVDPGGRCPQPGGKPVMHP
jgi:hypothetical protein